MAGPDELFLRENRLSGPIPSELGQLSSMFYFNLRHNELTGTIPTQLGNMKGLSWLILNENNLSGPIPSELGGFFALDDFWLQDNQLSGEVPEELSSLGMMDNSLGVFNISGNPGLFGKVPDEVCSAANITSFDCSATLCGCDCACSA